MNDSTNVNCTTDWDCPTTLICYTSELSWYYDAFGAEAGPSTCACSTWYGWTGSDCLEYSMPTYVSISLQAFTALYACVWAIKGLQTLWRVSRVDKGFSFFTAGNVTAIFATTALWVLIAWRLIAICTFLRPDLFTRRLKNGPNKHSELVSYDRAFTGLTATFTTLVALNVSLLWLQVAHETRKLRHQPRFLTVYRKVIIVFEIVFTAAIVVVMTLNQPFYTMLVAFPFIIFVVLSFIVGHRRLTALLHEASSTVDPERQRPKSKSQDFTAPPKTPETIKTEGLRPVVETPAQLTYGPNEAKAPLERYRKMLKFVHTTTRSAILWSCVTLVGGVAYAVLALDWKQYAPVGKISAATILNDIFVYGILGVLVAAQWYIWRVLSNRVKRISELEAKQDLSNNFESPVDPSFTDTSTFRVNMQHLASYRAAEKFKEKVASFHTRDGDLPGNAPARADEYV